MTPDMEEAAFWATSDLSMTKAKRQKVADGALAIEEYHRGIKQCCGVERCQARSERAQPQSYSVGNPRVRPVGMAAFGNEPQLV